MSKRKQFLAAIELARHEADKRAGEAALLRQMADHLEWCLRTIDRITAQERAKALRAPSRSPLSRGDSAPMLREDLTRLRAEIDRVDREISSVLELSELSEINPTFAEDASQLVVGSVLDVDDE